MKVPSALLWTFLAMGLIRPARLPGGDPSGDGHAHIRKLSLPDRGSGPRRQIAAPSPRGMWLPPLYHQQPPHITLYGLTGTLTEVKLTPMNDHDSTPLADRLVSDARLRLESWQAELQGLLDTAKTRYRGTLKELEAMVSSGSERAGEPLASRLTALRRSQELQQTAGEFDAAITRLSEAQSCLEAADELLQGKMGQAGPVGKPSDISMESVAIQAQEEERYRLAREIHDGPAQILANVALQLEYISKLAVKDPLRARDELVNIQRDLRLAVGEVRRFMYDLRPPALAQQGVGPAVESHCQRLAERFGMKISAQWESSSALAPSYDTALFRIVQEALQNVVKHAQATEVVVHATDRSGVLEVSVIDNGKGFDADGVRRLDPKHFGLAGMRARSQQIGAILEVTSIPGQGTKVLIKVPLAE